MTKPNYTLLTLSPKVEYALLALLEMAGQYALQIPITVSEITNKQDIPERYLEQILGALRRGGLLKSQRGSRGGYLLARDPNQITLLDIVTLIDGNTQDNVNKDLKTIENQLIDRTWQQANLAAQKVLAECRLADLYKQRQDYLATSLMYYI